MPQATEWRGSSAELCRQMGWGPGTVLYGAATEHEGDLRMLITAVGVDEVLGMQLLADGETDREMSWHLGCREWRAESQAIAYVSDMVRSQVLRGWLHGACRAALNDRDRLLSAAAQLQVAVNRGEPPLAAIQHAIAVFIGQLIEGPEFPLPAEECTGG